METNGSNGRSKLGRQIAITARAVLQTASRLIQFAGAIRRDNSDFERRILRRLCHLSFDASSTLIGTSFRARRHLFFFFLSRIALVALPREIARVCCRPFVLAAAAARDVSRRLSLALPRAIVQQSRGDCATIFYRVLAYCKMYARSGTTRESSSSGRGRVAAVARLSSSGTRRPGYSGYEGIVARYLAENDDLLKEGSCQTNRLFRKISRAFR